MTENLSGTIREQFSTMRHLYAGAVNTRLCAGDVAKHLYYDGKYTITAWQTEPSGPHNVQVYVTDQGVQITFTDHNDDDLPCTVHIAAPYTISGITTMVEGLLLAYRSAAGSTVDTPMCCSRYMDDDGPQVHLCADEPPRVRRSYYCPECHGFESVAVTDPHEARRLVAEVMAWQLSLEVLA